MTKESESNWPIIGHHQIISYLKNSLGLGRLNHAYIFCGPRQVGKTSIAEIFVQGLMCQNFSEKKEPLPCGECVYCRQMKAKTHPDIFWLNRLTDEKTGKLKKNISIDQVRELQGKLSLRSFLDSFKVAIINEAEILSLEAANSLLKTLEEPSAKTIIILIAKSVWFLPRTLVSRSQVINFLPVSSEAIINYLISQKIDRKKARTLAALAFGRPGVALNYLNDKESLIDSQNQVKELINLLKNEINSRFKTVDNLAALNDSDGLKAILNDWTKIIRDLIFIKKSLPNLISNLTLINDLNQAAAHYQIADLIKILRQLNLTKRYLEANINPKLALENLVLTF